MIVYRVKQDQGKKTVDVVTITINGAAVTWAGDQGMIDGLQALMRSRGLDPFTAGDLEPLRHLVSGSVTWIVKDQ